MTGLLSTLLLLIGGVMLYQYAALNLWILVFGIYLGLLSAFSMMSWWLLTPLWLLYVATSLIFGIKWLRNYLIGDVIFKTISAHTPRMSDTEHDALLAGTVSWEGELFAGAPNWKKLYDLPKPELSSEESAFLNGPVKKLCAMINDWEITHIHTDMPDSMWAFIKKEGFLGMIIPKRYGGKNFSAVAIARILSTLYGRSITVATTVGVPNSLGPAELILDYGTKEQKDYYLPRLANGQEVPCFALTAPRAGSDAASITDQGIVCEKTIKGKKVIGIKLNFDKRYITLSPVATLIGLAFKLYDPQRLLGEKEELGITCALLPSDTPGIVRGRRHFPLNTGFLNGPLIGKDVFIPIDQIIGGPKMAGQGWRMLMECLGAGRAISLPSSAVGGSKAAALASGAYAKLREQFNVPIAEFEGIQEPLARIAANTYMMDAVFLMTAVLIDQGEKPSVASAIVKYHTTELSRKIANDAMDIHGGKGICLGPSNYLGRGYQAAPIGITVEGANILTRCLIIFGQGAIRCHPFVFKELEAIREGDNRAFDREIFSHVGFILSNHWRSFCLGLMTPFERFFKRSKPKIWSYQRRFNRYASALATVSDIVMIVFGANLKRREQMSARLGDVLSYLYLGSAVLKRFQDDGMHKEDWDIVQYACESLLHDIQESFVAILDNLPNRMLSSYLHLFVFPLGKHQKVPSDQLTSTIASHLTRPSHVRERLSHDVFKEAIPNNPIGEMERLFHRVFEQEALLKKFRMIVKSEKLADKAIDERIKLALNSKLISKEEAKILSDIEAARSQVIGVDDFDHDELARCQQKAVPSEPNLVVVNGHSTDK